MDIHNWIVVIHNLSMDIHKSFMDINNWQWISIIVGFRPLWDSIAFSAWLYYDENQLTEQALISETGARPPATTLLSRPGLQWYLFFVFSVFVYIHISISLTQSQWRIYMRVFFVVERQTRCEPLCAGSSAHFKRPRKYCLVRYEFIPVCISKSSQYWFR